MASLDLLDIAVGRRGTLVKEIRKVLAQPFSRDELGNDELRWPALALGSKDKRLPTAGSSSDGNELAEDAEAELLHGAP